MIKTLVIKIKKTNGGNRIDFVANKKDNVVELINSLNHIKSTLNQSITSELIKAGYEPKDFGTPEALKLARSLTINDLPLKKKVAENSEKE